MTKNNTISAPIYRAALTNFLKIEKIKPSKSITKMAITKGGREAINEKTAINHLKNKFISSTICYNTLTTNIRRSRHS